MKTNILLTVPTKVGVQNYAHWKWSPLEQKKDVAFIQTESIDPEAHVVASLPVKNDFRFAYGGRQPCVGQGPHMASLAVGNAVNEEALMALSRKASCEVCGLSVPGLIADRGWFEVSPVWSTKSGKLEPGCCYWISRTDCLPSKYTSAFSKKYGNGQHLIVVLPDMAHWDVMAPFDEKTQVGWKIQGVLPTISVEPIVTSRQWSGTVEDGFLVGDM